MKTDLFLSKEFKKLIQIIIYLGLLFVVISCHRKAVPGKIDYVKKELNSKDLQNYNYLFSEALKQKILGNIPKSIAYYEQCLKINTESDASMFELSNLYSLVGEYKISLEHAKNAVKEDPENLWYKLHLLNLYLTLNMNDSSIMILKEIHVNYPERTDLYFNLGGIYKENGDFKKALKVFEEIEDIVGYSPNIILQKAEIYEKQKKFEKAEDEINKLIDKYQSNINYYIILAELFYKQGKRDKALEMYSKVEQIEINSNAALISKIGFYRNINNYDLLFTVLDTVVSRNSIDLNKKIQIMISFITDPKEIKDYPNEILLRLRDLQKLNNEDNRINAVIADYYMNIENYHEASEMFKQYIKKDKTNYMVWEQLLYVENIIGNYQDLYDHSKDALSLFRTAPVLYFFNGVACTELGKPYEAEKILKRGMKFAEGNKPLMIQYLAMLGETYRNLGKYDLSDKSFEDALELEPKNLIVLNNYSYYLSLRKKNLKKALKMSSVCIKEEPLNATYLDTYGWILFQMRKYNDAIKYLKMAVENDDSPSPEILEHYGDVLKITGEDEEAIKYWIKASNAGGNKDELKQKISNARH